MKLLTMLYIIIICPLELLFEVIFYLSNSILSNPGLSIAALSILVNLLVSPLYARADAIQAEERELESGMKKWVSHIKKTFKGDERFMMLQTYYRQNNYKPAYVFRSLLPLMLQVPFFIAAYRLLSQIKMLHGFQFGPIHDLGTPDGLLNIYGITINVLPVVMTILNIVSGMIYTKGGPFKEKLQLYGVALVFLLLLYKSPSGLVLYWTLNNVFSIFRNLISKLKNSRAFLLKLSSSLGLIVMGIGLGRSVYSMRQRIIIMALGFLMTVPEIICGYVDKKKVHFELPKADNKAFILSAIYLAVFTGSLIPSAVIGSSALEFVSVSSLSNPCNYVLSSICLAAGTFVVWMSVFYYFAKDQLRTVFTYIVWALDIIFTIDYMFFGTRFGILSPQLQYEISPSYSLPGHILNMFVIAAACLICFILMRKMPKLVVSVVISGILISTGMSAFNMINISRTYTNAIHTADYLDANPTISLSRDKKNVVVIMMDKMISYYIPYLMNERPELYEAFDGFTYYPNAVSFGYSTNAGSPGLYGGYEYIPKRLNERSDELLVDKHNEALKVMPVLYEENGYDVTVCDASLANYSWIPDLSIYDEYPDIKKYVTIGALQSKTESLDPMIDPLNRNFFCYSLYRSVPSILQSTLYNRGNYNTIDKLDLVADEWNSKQIMDGLFRSSGMDANFMGSYSVLDRLGDLTRVNEDGKGCFLMLANKATHDPQLLSLPDYVPSEYVDNTKYGNDQFVKYDAEGNEINIGDEVNVTAYQCTMATMMKLGEWFDYLRAQDLFDNTKIILVSDHATNVGLNDNFLVDNRDENGKNGTFDALWLTCVLLVKDFNEEGFKKDDTFMTNADVPTIATRDTIDDPVNPFSGKKIDSSYKEKEKLELMGEEDWSIETNNGYKFKPAMYYSVHDNIYENANWSFLGYY